MPYEPVTTLPSSPESSKERPTGLRRVRYVLTWVLGLGVILGVGLGFGATQYEHHVHSSFSARLDVSSAKLSAATKVLKNASGDDDKAAALKSLHAAEKANEAVRATAPGEVPVSPFWIGTGITALLFMLNRSWRPAKYADEAPDSK